MDVSYNRSNHNCSHLPVEKQSKTAGVSLRARDIPLCAVPRRILENRSGLQRLVFNSRKILYFFVFCRDLLRSPERDFGSKQMPRGCWNYCE